MKKNEVNGNKRHGQYFWATRLDTVAHIVVDGECLCGKYSEFHGKNYADQMEDLCITCANQLEGIPED